MDFSPDVPALPEKSRHAVIDTEFTGTYRYISAPKFRCPNKQTESSGPSLGV